MKYLALMFMSKYPFMIYNSGGVNNRAGSYFNDVHLKYIKKVHCWFLIVFPLLFTVPIGYTKKDF